MIKTVLENWSFPSPDVGGGATERSEVGVGAASQHRTYFLFIFLLLLSACTSPSVPSPEPASSLQILTVGEVRAARATLLHQRVTVQGIVTSTEPAWATLQSGGAGLLLPRPEEALIAQELLITGRVAEVEGQLALIELEEVLVEQQGLMPEPAPLTLAPEQESLYVEVTGATLDAQGVLRLPDGRSLALRAADSEVARRLTPNARLDAIRGVLRRSAEGWSLVPALARDVRVAPPLRSVCEIQGSGERSPHKGERVETVGIVTAAAREGDGFFLQAPDCDGDPATSDGLFVAALPVQGHDLVGSQVRLRGRVEEFYQRTQLELDADTLLIEAEGLPLPAAVLLPAASLPFESLEGMRVRVEAGRAVGPTSRFGEFALDTTEPPLLVVGPYEVAVGASVRGVEGPLDFTFGAFKVQPSQAIAIEQGEFPRAFTAEPLNPNEWSLATLNAENLFDSEDDPGRDDEDATLAPEALAVKLEKLAATIAGPLGFPTILALQEVENLRVLEQLAAHPSLAGRYEPLLLEGHDGRGIDQALLVERGRVTVLESALANGEDFLFERPPLVAHLLVDGQYPFYLINNHFKSKRGGELETRPRRVAQARYVAALVTQLAGGGAEVVVVGDLNDDEESQTLATLVEGTTLVNLWGTLHIEERYSYIHLGVREGLDHVLATPGLGSRVRDFVPLRLNADYPYSLSQDPETPLRSSDHDPLRVIFRLP